MFVFLDSICEAVKHGTSYKADIKPKQGLLLTCLIVAPNRQNFQ